MKVETAALQNPRQNFSETTGGLGPQPGETHPRSPGISCRSLYMLDTPYYNKATRNLAHMRRMHFCFLAFLVASAPKLLLLYFSLLDLLQIVQVPAYKRSESELIAGFLP